MCAQTGVSGVQSSTIIEISILALAAVAALLLGGFARPIYRWVKTSDKPFDNSYLNAIPAVMWVEKNNIITWSNNSFKNLEKTIGYELNIAKFTMSEKPNSDREQTRAHLKQSNPKNSLHFDISTQHSQGTIFYVATSAKAAVKAENDRARFVQTLSETFAHLPIGMAVFDNERDLSLFNPALAELLDVSPLWLAKKPSLRDFLDRLHDKGALPEPRNFKSWRDQITEMERSAESGTYFDDWHMPNNKVFRVTGRPHPKGAVAFVFEDISRSLAAEREYRMEIERLYAALDSVDAGIIIFDAAGALSFANDAFDAIWETDYSKSLVAPTAIEVAEVWNQRCQPSPVMGDIREFIATVGERERWSGTLKTKSGLALEVNAVPMVGNYSMVEFSNLQYS
jgi:PAS domain-containing protein